MKLRPKALGLLMAAMLAAALPAAHAAETREAAGPGLGYGLTLAPQWQARLGWSGVPGPLPADTGSSSRSLSLFGDYYIPRAFGLRATGGVVLGAGAGSQSATLWPALGGSRLALSPASSLTSLRNEGGLQEGELTRDAAPYFGLGYTGLAAQGSLGFFADLGLRGLKPRSSVQFGGTTAPADPEIWRPWREWRFEPVLQLGVSYAF